jgi:soluble lytic murein transglycosylase-like protein
VDLTTLDGRKELAKRFATAHLLDPAIVAAVCEQESGWNPFAVRYENEFLHRYVKPLNPLAPTTPEITRACSFGLMQIMGLTAMELGWRGYYLTQLCDPEIGMEFGCRKLRKCFDLHPNDNIAALLAYNGGSNPIYASQVLARVSKYF